MQHRYKMLFILFIISAFFCTFSFANDELISIQYGVEENPQLMIAAKEQAINEGLPLSIYLPGGYFIYVLTIEEGQVLYGIIENLAHPHKNFNTATFEQLNRDYDLSGAEHRYYDSKKASSTTSTEMYQPGDSLLLIPDWTNDKVLAFDAQSGDLVDIDFIPTSIELSSPKEARIAPWGTVTISDQLEDLVQEFDTSGVFLASFAPAGGVNTAILDNIRGHSYLSGGNLVVAVGGGTNDDAIAEFDQTGNYLGNFIANGAGGLDSPFGIWFRSNDVLVSASTSDAIHRYDLSGNFLDNFALVSNFPQQVIELPNGNVAVANFGGTSGILVYNSSGTLLSTLTGVTGNRGVWQLGNGNFITTNGGGVHEIDGTSGALIRTIFAAASAQFVNLYVVPSQAAQKLLISELVVTPTAGEFVEIYNPGPNAVDLSDYYLTDATDSSANNYYYQIVDGGGGINATSDFHVRFPDMATIQPGEYQTVAMNGTDFITQYAVQPTYELTATDPTIPDMREVIPGSIGSSAGLSNAGEVAILYHWDGMTDLVGDVDYVVWGDKVEAVDKTGVEIDGPDPGTDSSMYLPDTPIPNQMATSPGQPHAFGESVHRIDFTEGAQITSGGNGITGADETSENLDQTFTGNSLPSPNSSWQPANTARVQLVHNVADPAAFEVDVYFNGSLLVDDFTFREATPFITVPAGILLNLGIAPGNSTSVTDTIRNFPLVFEADSTYIGFASGVIDTTVFAPNPDGEDLSLTIHGQDQAREISQTPGSVEFFVFHGITDAPTIDIYLQDGTPLFDNILYGDATDYITVAPDSYIVDIKDSLSSELYASFKVDLTTYADSALAVFASGFAEPDQNQNGPGAALLAALPNGIVIEFPMLTTNARVQLIHNSPDPALSIIDVYFDDYPLIDDFSFREATPFLDLPAERTFLLGFAPSNSNSANDTFKAFLGNFERHDTLIGLVTGVLDSSIFLPNPDGRNTSLDIWGNDFAREVSQTPGEVEFFVMHGSPDAPAVDVVVRTVGTLFGNVYFTDVTNYINVPPAQYIIDLYDSMGTTLLAAFDADLTTLADSAVTVFASGFLDTSAANQNGPSFGLYVALANGTVLGLPGLPVGITNTQSLLPDKYALHQNYPNPFNPTTTIRYDLKNNTAVSLKVYNLLGQKIRTLVNNQQAAGYREVAWDGRNDSGVAVASGIYIYRIEAGDFVQTRKMVLMK